MKGGRIAVKNNWKDYSNSEVLTKRCTEKICLYSRQSYTLLYHQRHHPDYFWPHSHDRLQSGVNLAFYRRQTPSTQTSLLVRFASGGVSSWKHLKPCRFVEISQEFPNALVEKRLIKRELWVENLYICRNLASATRRSQYSKRPNSRLFQVYY